MAIVEEFQVVGDTSLAVRAVKKLEDATDKGFKKINDAAAKAGEAISKEFGDSLIKQIAIGNLVSGAVTKAFTSITSAINASVSSALEYERTMRQQAAALGVFGVASEGAQSTLEAQSTVLERLTGQSQEEIRTLQNRAVALGVSVGATDDLIRASLSLANVMGRNVNEVMNQLLKSQSGLLEETLKQIPAIADLTAEELKNGDAIKIVNEQFGEFVGLATAGGGVDASLTTLTTSWGNLGKAIARAATESETTMKAFREEADRAFVAQKLVDGGEWFKALLLEMSPLSEQARKDVSELANALRKEEDATAAAAAAQLEHEELLKRLGGDGGVVAGLTFNLTKLHAEAKKAADEFNRLASMVGTIEDASAMFADTDLSRPPALPGMIDDDDLAAAEQKRAEARMTIAERHGTMYLEFVQRLEDKKNQILADSISYEEELRAKSATHVERAQSAMYSRMMDIATQASGMMAATALDALERMAEGQRVSGAEVVREFMSMMGKQLLVSGIAHSVGALGRIAFGDYTAIAALGPAGAEIAVGTALMAGNLAMAASGAGVSVGSGRGGGGGGGGGGSSYGGGGGGYIPNSSPYGGRVSEDNSWMNSLPSVRRPNGGQSSDMISSEGLTIVINGPTFLSEAEIGQAIERARQAAKARGYIK